MGGGSKIALHARFWGFLPFCFGVGIKMASNEIFDCRACGACCSVLLVPFPFKPEAGWLNARGCKWIDGYLAFKHSCKAYSKETGKCLIQASKPRTCSVMPVGRKDCLLARKAWKELNEVV